MATASDDLYSYYKTNFELIQHHKYSPTDIDNWLPWERTLYIDLLIKHIEKETKS